MAPNTPFTFHSRGVGDRPIVAYSVEKFLNAPVGSVLYGELREHLAEVFAVTARVPTDAGGPRRLGVSVKADALPAQLPTPRPLRVSPPGNEQQLVREFLRQPLPLLAKDLFGLCPSPAHHPPAHTHTGAAAAAASQPQATAGLQSGSVDPVGETPPLRSPEKEVLQPWLTKLHLSLQCARANCGALVWDTFDLPALTLLQAIENHHTTSSLKKGRESSRPKLSKSGEIAALACAACRHEKVPLRLVATCEKCGLELARVDLAANPEHVARHLMEVRVYLSYR